MNVLDVQGKRVVVVGLGASGIAACKLLQYRGARVVGTDAKPKTAVSGAVLELEAHGITLALGGHGSAGFEEATLIVVSPGVPMFPELERAEARGVPVWGEVELAVRALKSPAPVIAIGGTNGKSTTTSLIGALLEGAKRRVFVGGNLGEPLAAHADQTFDAIVLEVSSFQMERVDAFHPAVSILLNVTADHLDRYPSMEAYAAAKGNAFLRQTASDLAVVPALDDVCMAQAKRGQARVVTFGEGGDVAVTRDAIVCGGERYSRDAIALSGGHNALNVAAALAAVAPFGISPAIVREVLRTFTGLAHRMAFVRERRAVRYYDDSKGTNVGASVTAIRGAREAKVVLIAGGRDKGGSYGPLVEALRERGRAAILLGEARELLAKAIGNAVPFRMASSMDEAVTLASKLAQEGDAVLLSPACSSFDMFRDYKERGDAFVRAVMALPES